MVGKWQIPGVCDRDLFPNEQRKRRAARVAKGNVVVVAILRLWGARRQTCSRVDTQTLAFIFWSDSFCLWKLLKMIFDRLRRNVLLGFLIWKQIFLHDVEKLDLNAAASKMKYFFDI